MKLYKSRVYVLFIALLWILSLQVQIGIGILIALVYGGPAFYRQKRIGQNGKPFWLLKFRTMRMGAEDEQLGLRKFNEADGPVFKIRDDPRFTPIGKFLSHTGLDELPQLWNVLRGDMALVGPRPLPVSEAKKLKPWQQKRHVIKPGIISPWIVDGYHSNTFDAWMKSDVQYTKQKSFPYDAQLLLRAFLLFITLLYRETQRYLKK